MNKNCLHHFWTWFYGFSPALGNSKLKQLSDFQYLDSWKDQTEKDLGIRKAKTWAACNKLTAVWKSNLSRDLKIRFFGASVETVLLYGSESWTLTASLENQLDGCYARLLRAALDKSYRDGISNKELYGDGDLPSISTTLQTRRLQFSGHCWSSKNEIVSQMLLCNPRGGAHNNFHGPAGEGHCVNYTSRAPSYHGRKKGEKKAHHISVRPK